MTANTGCTRYAPTITCVVAARERERGRGVKRERESALLEPTKRSEPAFLHKSSKQHTHSLLLPPSKPTPCGPLLRHDRIIPSNVCGVCSRARERVVVCLRPTTLVCVPVAVSASGIT